MKTNPLSVDLDAIVDHTRSLWDQLKNQRIFISGGTGFFGCWLLESLVWANDHLNLKVEAVILSRNPEAFAKKCPHLYAHPALKFHQGDVRDFVFPEGKFSHIIHAATDVDDVHEAKAIADGTKHMLDFAAHCEAKKFLLVSSGAVYGEQPAGLTNINEHHEIDGHHLSAYATGKYVSEQLCRLYAEQYPLEIKIARCFTFVGPYLPLDSSFAVCQFMNNALKNEVIRVAGDGTALRSYLYAADLTIWLWTILFSGKSMYPYNVGSERVVNIAELAHMVAKLFKPARSVLIMQEVATDKRTQQYVPSTQRAQQELGLRERYDFAQMLRSAQKWYEAQNLKEGSKA